MDAPVDGDGLTPGELGQGVVEPLRLLVVAGLQEKKATAPAFSPSSDPEVVGG